MQNINQVQAADGLPEAGDRLKEVMANIRAELDRSMEQFPNWPTDPLHASGIVQEESGEFAQAVMQAVYEPHKSTHADVEMEAYQTAAMAIRFLLSMQRYRWATAEHHPQMDLLSHAEVELP